MKKGSFFPLLSEGKKGASERGFTLIELIIAISINGMIAATLFRVFYYNKEVFERENSIAAMHQKVTAALNIIGNAVSNAGYDPLNKGFTPIDPLSSKSSIILYADINENGKVPPEDKNRDVDEAVVFTFDAKKRKIKNWINQTVADDIIDLSFTYEPSVPHLARIVTISVTAITNKEDPSFTDGYNKTGTLKDGTCRTFTLSAKVALRNSL